MRLQYVKIRKACKFVFATVPLQPPRLWVSAEQEKLVVAKADVYVQSKFRNGTVAKGTVNILLDSLDHLGADPVGDFFISWIKYT